MPRDFGPAPVDDDPGPQDEHYSEPDEGSTATFHDVPETDEEERVTDPVLARWLGLQAARMGVLRPAQDLIHPLAIGAYRTGADLPASTKLPHGLTESQRSHWIRELRRVGGRLPEKAGDVSLPATIVRMVQRHDIGTGTRYDVTLRSGGKDYTLRDLISKDLLEWERLRPIAFDARLVLPPLGKVERPLWLAEVARAMETVDVRAMVPEESETVDMRNRMLEMAVAARRWEYAPEDTRPIGLVHILRGELIGWPREPMKGELRSRIGRLSRVGLPRAVQSLGWVAREWKYENRSVHVWCTTQERWAKLLIDPRGTP